MHTTTLAQASSEFLEKMVADAMKRYEPRACQTGMMEACSRFIEGGGLLMAEAGTGHRQNLRVSDSNNHLGQKGDTFRTRTINLQEQLAHKDLKVPCLPGRVRLCDS